jgi:hypothetical protein
MRLVALFIGSAGAVLILACLLLEAFAGEVNAAFLTTGVAVTITLLGSSCIVRGTRLR